MKKMQFTSFKILLVIVFITWGHVRSLHAQGAIEFQTFYDPVYARVTYLDGTPITTGFKAQLFAGPLGTPMDSLAPQYMVTSFFSDAEVRLHGYVRPAVVTIPGIPAGDQVVTVIMRVYDGADWFSSNCRGESNPINITLGGGTLPPSTLLGLQSFQVNCIPEPGTLVLVGLGLAFAFSSRFIRVKKYGSSTISVECGG